MKWVPGFLFHHSSRYWLRGGRGAMCAAAHAMHAQFGAMLLPSQHQPWHALHAAPAVPAVLAQPAAARHPTSRRTPGAKFAGGCLAAAPPGPCPDAKVQSHRLPPTPFPFSPSARPTHLFRQLVRKKEANPQNDVSAPGMAATTGNTTFCCSVHCPARSVSLLQQIP